MKELTENKVQRLVSDILKVYIKAELSDKVKYKTQAWFVSNIHTKEKENALRSLWNEIEIKENDKKTEKKAWKKVSKKIGLKQPGHQTLFRKNFLRIAAVIISTSLIIGGTYLILNNRQDLSVITKIEQTLIRTADEIEYILLNDGTEVWINKKSEFTYGDNREVHLKGEALFKVKHNHEQQFTVTTEHLKATVWGTSFNIQAYPDKNELILNLYEGKLEVSTADTLFQMTPGEECIMDCKLNTLVVKKTHKKLPDWERMNINYEEVRL